MEYADIPPGGSVAVLGLGPIGDMCARIARHRGAGQVIGVDLVPERLARARAAGHRHASTSTTSRRRRRRGVRDRTDGRGTDAVIDAVGMEAHGAPSASSAQQLTGSLPGRDRGRS